MPWGLTRFHHSGQSHFVTFCCYHRRCLLTTNASCRIFESALGAGAAQLQTLRLWLCSHAGACSPPAQRTTTGYAGGCTEVVEARSMAFDWRSPLKPKTGLNGAPQRFWQKRYYDFNIRNYPQFVEKLRY